MHKKTGTESHNRIYELINKKVKEINDRRRGIKVTSIEDELDRQELNNYMRYLGIEHENISLESASMQGPSKNNVFYATMAVEALIEILSLYIIASILLMPNASMSDYLIAILMMGVFVAIGLRIFKEIKR
jgi:hypothetical protein